MIIIFKLFILICDRQVSTNNNNNNGHDRRSNLKSIKRIFFEFYDWINVGKKTLVNHTKHTFEFILKAESLQ